MKKLILMLFMAIAMTAYTQTSAGVKPKTTIKTVESLTKNCTLTTLLYNGMKVWQTKNNKYFVIKFSQKTHNPYRYYVEYTKP